MGDFKHTTNLLRPFYRGLPVIIAVMVLGVLCAKKYLHYATPMYESIAQIKLADAAIGISHANLYRDFDVFATSNKIGAEVEMLKSAVVINRALRKLDLGILVHRIGDLHKTELYNDCPFRIIAQARDNGAYDSVYCMVVYNDSLLQITTPSKLIVKGKMNHVLTLPHVDLFITKNDSLLAKRPDLLVNDKYDFTLNSHQKLVDDLREKIDVMALDKEVPVLRIAFKSPSAQKSADIVNRVSEAYIMDYIEEKFTAADTTVNFLDKEVTNYSGKLASSEQSIEAFRNQHNVISIKQETETNLRKLSELKSHLAGLQMDLVAIDSLDNYIKKGKDNFTDLAPNFQTFNDLLSTEIIKKIKALQSDKHDLLLKYTPANEKVKVVDAKLNDLYSYLQESIQNTRANLQLKYNDLNKTIRESEAEFTSFPFKDRNMTILERNFNLNDQIYRFLREKKTDAEIARAASISFHRVISSGEVPDKPVSPNPTLMKVLAGFLGFLGGIFLIYLVHFMKGRVNNEVSVQKNSDTPIFARIPFLKKQLQHNIVFEKLAIDLQVKGDMQRGSVITISSFGVNEGKQTIAAGLAKGAMLLGRKLIVIDAGGSTRREPPPGVAFAAIDSITPLWRQPEELQRAIALLLGQYELVIIKNTPIALDSAALLLMSPASLNLLVLDSRRTKLKRVEETDLMIEKLKLTNIQFLLNRDGYTPSLLKQGYVFFRKLFPFKKQPA